MSTRKSSEVEEAEEAAEQLAEEMPDDPDPTPMVVSDSSQETKAAKRAEQKRVSRNYGRSKTVLAGDTSSTAAKKKTVLGG